MEDTLKTALIVLGSYLLGAFPSSYIMGRVLKGIDLREHGSGNLGAANTFRVLGPAAAIPVLLLDIGKGYLAVKLAVHYGGSSSLLILITALIAILGHNYSIFVRFSGGKGVGTTAGVFLAMAPVAVGIGFVVWGLMVGIFRIVSLASMISALTLPLNILLVNRYLGGTTNTHILILSVLVAALVVYKHRSNIRRLREGTEPRIF
ncbi:MAG TPA: glycerol-3-phosphate 1-O-acyltransferase PlsY [Candidatus Krumholzibacterium sp.]|nr:glycerol-3-phosphate 1-O-acyltransferase PlsY [Candidatus Krumholzibacterium sp.]